MTDHLHEERLEHLRAELTDPRHDPRMLHDDLRKLADSISATGQHVPADLREALAEAEAEVLEDFHDNLPV